MDTSTVEELADLEMRLCLLLRNVSLNESKQTEIRIKSLLKKRAKLLEEK